MTKTNTLFITGTDTGVGKTTFAIDLLKYLNKKNYKTIGFKPVAAGGLFEDGQLMNQDAVLLSQYSNIKLPYDYINPFCFKLAVSPNIASEKEKITLSVNKIIKKYKKIFSMQQVKTADYILIEGVGGWNVPINDNETMADVAVAFGFPIILVVGIRLGCINHTLLTYDSIRNRNLEIVGWIANVLDTEMECIEENMDTIQNFLKVPLLKIENFLN